MNRMSYLAPRMAGVQATFGWSVWPRLRVAFRGLLAITLLGSVLLSTAQPAFAAFQVYVPMVATTSGAGGSGGISAECGLNAQEAAIAEFMLTHNAQGRANPVCDPILAQVARGRARDMAQRKYFSHTNPDGEGPNLLVRRAGYPLPSWYPTDRAANHIESIGGGHTSPTAVWQGWLGSSGHRTHVLGEIDFYAEQEAYGVGYYFDPNSPLKHYWVFLSAPVAD